MAFENLRVFKINNNDNKICWFWHGLIWQPWEIGQDKHSVIKRLCNNHPPPLPVRSITYNFKTNKYFFKSFYYYSFYLYLEMKGDRINSIQRLFFFYVIVISTALLVCHYLIQQINVFLNRIFIDLKKQKDFQIKSETPWWLEIWEMCQNNLCWSCYIVILSFTVLFFFSWKIIIIKKKKKAYVIFLISHLIKDRKLWFPSFYCKRVYSYRKMFSMYNYDSLLSAK